MFFWGERVVAIDRSEWLRIIPDLVVEVLSPTSRDYGRRTKRQTYERLGVPHYWIADPETHRISENVLQPSGYYQARVIDSGTAFRSALFPDLEIDLTRIFA